MAWTVFVYAFAIVWGIASSALGFKAFGSIGEFLAVCLPILFVSSAVILVRGL